MATISEQIREDFLKAEAQIEKIEAILNKHSEMFGECFAQERVIRETYFYDVAQEIFKLYKDGNDY